MLRVWLDPALVASDRRWDNVRALAGDALASLEQVVQADSAEGLAPDARRLVADPPLAGAEWDEP